MDDIHYYSDNEPSRTRKEKLTSRLNKSALKDSITQLKQNIQPQLRKIKSKHIIEQYSNILDNYDKEKKRILQEQKSKQHSRKNLKNLSSNILEYSFLKEDNTLKMNHSNLHKTNDHQNKSFSYSQSKIVNIKKPDSMYEKNRNEKLIFERKVEEQRKNKKYQEMSQLKPSPGLSDNSKKIIMDKFIYEKPLYMRYQEEVELKKMKLDNLKRNYEAEAVYEWDNFNSSMNDLSKNNNFIRSNSCNQVNFENWLEVNEMWKQNREAKVEYLKQVMYDRETNNDELYFIPKINKTSRILANVKNQREDPNLEISPFDKLHKKHEEKLKKLENIKEKHMPTFQPSINKVPGYISKRKFGTAGNPQTISQTYYFEASENPTLYKNSSNTVNTISTKSSKISKPKNENINNLKNTQGNTDSKVSKKNDNQKESKKSEDMLYKLNIRNNSAWNNPVNSMTEDIKLKEIVNISKRFGK